MRTNTFGDRGHIKLVPATYISSLTLIHTRVLLSTDFAKSLNGQKYNTRTWMDGDLTKNFKLF